ncbi:PDR/VanB family oxidoreductase [Microbacterium sp. A196]|uniref:PDR/VanB family oxidoreductase n=1 Tax=unclassified Microbacterium TaxID=2609290 RepID=UPI003FD600A4
MSTPTATLSKPDQELTRTLSVARIDEVADGVRAVTLAAVDGSDLPAWTPGAHIDVLLGNGIVRQYSLSSDPYDLSSYRIGVLREPASRGGSEYVFTELALGDQIEITGPRNNFALTDASSYIFIAGGIGVTPVLAQAREAKRLGREYVLVYGGRSRASMGFLDELAAEHGDRLQVWPQDEKGIIDLPSLLGTPREDTKVYCCGPAPLLGAVEEQCTTWAREALHIERFVPKIVEASDDAVDEFEVELSASGLTVHVGADQSILQAAMDAGVDVFFSCQEGTCGSCETPIIEGEADHRDSVLSEAEQEENTCMMICVSRAKCPRLVLDL